MLYQAQLLTSMLVGGKSVVRYAVYKRLLHSPLCRQQADEPCSAAEACADCRTELRHICFVVLPACLNAATAPPELIERLYAELSTFRYRLVREMEEGGESYPCLTIGFN